MGDLISRQAAIDALNEQIEQCNKALSSFDISMKDEYAVKVERASLEAYKEQLENLPSAQPEIVRCCKCGFWDRDTLRHQFNDFRDWNEAECEILAERDPYHEINRYTEADDFCSHAERRTDESD